MSVKLDEKDLSILTLIQENSKLTANQIAKKINIPITTVFAKTKRMEEMGVIKQYRAILSPEKLNLGTAAFILAAVSYRTKNEDETPISQRQVAE
jgi:Lrp/AsnC family leucine-responsive transcriptional regulator